MKDERTTTQPIQAEPATRRSRLPLSGEFVLAFLPTVTILIVLGLIEALNRQRLLFASLASSAFLIYLDPNHDTNSIRTLVLSQMMAAATGLFTFLLLGPGYLSAGSAMVITIILMILLDAVHPPAVSTSLSFALRAGDESNILIFGMAVAITAILVVLQRLAAWLLVRFTPLTSLDETGRQAD